jgi:hypothetical protein
MNLTWPWLLGLFLPVCLVAWWALRRPRRRVQTVPSLTPWTKALAQGARSDRSPTPRLRPSWLCLLLGVILAVLAGADLGRDARPVRRHVTLLIAGGEMDRLDFENAAAAFLGRLDAADRVRLVFPPGLPDAMVTRGWISPSVAQQAIRNTPLVPVPASISRFPVDDIDPTQTFLLAPADTVAPDSFGATLIACRSATGPVVCSRATTTPRDEGGMDVFVLLRNDGVDSRAVELSWWTGRTLDDARRRAQNYQLMDQRVLGPGAQEVVTFESAGRLAGIEIVDVTGGTRQEVVVTASERARTRVFVSGKPNAMLDRFVAVHPALERTSVLGDADVLIGNGQGLPRWDGPAVLFDVASPVTGPPSIGPRTLTTAQVNPDHALMNGVDLSAVAVREVASEISTSDSAETIVSYDGVVLIAADVRAASPQIQVAFDIDPQNTNWTSDPSFVIFMTNAMVWVAGTPTATHATICPGEAPRDWIEGWQSVGGWPMTGIHYWPMPGFWVDQTGVVHAVSKVGFSGAQPAVSGVESAREVVLPVATRRAERRSLGWMLAAMAGGLWLFGWVLAGEGR